MQISSGPDESYNEGRMSYVAGERSDANPYERGSREYGQWRAGWNDMALLDAATCGPEDDNGQSTQGSKE